MGATVMRPIVVAGATGTIGRALMRALARHEGGPQLRAIARNPVRWSSERAVMITADLAEPQTFRAALDGAGCAYYLVHGMRRPGFERRDPQIARAFGHAAAAAGVTRIVFFGAMPGGRSRHLRARYAVGRALRESGLDVVELGAAAVLGAGSPVFELIHHLVATMPVVPCPRGSRTPTQPIALADAVAYLVAALDEPACAGARLAVGGSEVVTWRELMRLHADVLGLRRRFIDLPVAARSIAAAWIGLVSPVPRVMARQLVEGMPDPLVVRGRDARRLFPSIRPRGVRDALRAALAEASPRSPRPW